MMQTIFCFVCGNNRLAEDSVVVRAHPINMHFCKKHAHLAATIPERSAEPVVTEAPRTEPVAPKVTKPKPSPLPTKVKVDKSIRTESLAAWVRNQAAQGLSPEDIAKALPSAYPDSKPGLQPKLSMGYVKCYLSRS